MKEIELKLLNTTHKNLEPKLKKLGATKIFEGELKALFFDTKKSKETFRLRKEGNKTFLTHKKTIPSNEFKIMEETEIEVSNFKNTKKIIENLGFKQIGEIKKTRISYKLDKIKIEFDKFHDKYEHIPEFMEIEAENKKELKKYIKLLGYKFEEFKPWSGKKVIDYYKTKNHLKKNTKHL